jgi:4-hydroxy-3-polyprenylbenzoate decarboxylase
MALALQVADVGDVAQEIQLILKASRQPICAKLEFVNRNSSAACAPEARREAPCQEIVHRIGNGDDFSLRDLPILKCWPKDGGRFITLANVHTRDPERCETLGFTDAVYDQRTTGMHWQLHKVGARHGQRYYERGERMPVAVTLGGDPVCHSRLRAAAGRFG